LWPSPATEPDEDVQRPSRGNEAGPRPSMCTRFQQPSVRRAAGRRNSLGTPFVPTPLSRHGKRRGHPQGEAERSSPLAGLTARAALRGIQTPNLTFGRCRNAPSPGPPLLGLLHARPSPCARWCSGDAALGLGDIIECGLRWKAHWFWAA